MRRVGSSCRRLRCRVLRNGGERGCYGREHCEGRVLRREWGETPVREWERDREWERGMRRVGEAVVVNERAQERRGDICYGEMRERERSGA